MIFKADYGPAYARRLKEEFDQAITSELRDTLLTFDAVMRSEQNIPIVITCLVRTAAENFAVNGVPMSSHLRGDAADIRTGNWTQPQIAFALKWFQAHFGNQVCAVYHDAGSGHHLHINVNWGWSSKNDHRQKFQPIA